MLEEEVKKAVELAKRSGRRGWVLVKLPNELMGAFQSPSEAKRAAREPGVYVLVDNT